MKGTMKLGLSLLVMLLMFSCSSSVKVLNSWKAEQETVNKFKKKKILVIARTADNQARLAFENEIAEQLRSQGYNATESYTRAPMLFQKELTEERVKFIRKIFELEGYNGVVITVVKDKSQSTVTTSSGMYVGGGYGSYYPNYYGSFYNYYATPYAYGPYYSSVGGYIPLSSNTRLVTDYVLETVMYNLDEPEENQLVAVVTTKIDDPHDADKAAKQYVAKIVESYQKKLK
jgi:hypothetical protein